MTTAFCPGKGWLPRAAEKAAQRATGGSVSLVNYTDAGCGCGYGCAPYTCRASRRHWFEGPDDGEPFATMRAKGTARAIEPWVEPDGSARPRRRRR